MKESFGYLFLLHNSRLAAFYNIRSGSLLKHDMCLRHHRLQALRSSLVVVLRCDAVIVRHINRPRFCRQMSPTHRASRRPKRSATTSYLWRGRSLDQTAAERSSATSSRRKMPTPTTGCESTRCRRRRPSLTYRTSLRRESMISECLRSTRLVKANRQPPDVESLSRTRKVCRLSLVFMTLSNSDVNSYLVLVRVGLVLVLILVLEGLILVLVPVGLVFVLDLVLKA